jgi:hypothetical protein
MKSCCSRIPAPLNDLVYYDLYVGSYTRLVLTLLLGHVWTGLTFFPVSFIFCRCVQAH